MPRSREIIENRFYATVGKIKIPISVLETAKCPRSAKTPIALIVYGGGIKFSQDELLLMKRQFLRRGVVPASFVFRGHIPGTDFFGTGLHTRVKDIKAVVRKLKDACPESPLSVVAVSMGGYIATFLNSADMENLILVGPAAYHPDAVKNKLNFGPEFKALITRNRSWENSDGFSNIRKFAGTRLLVIKFDQDAKIPPEIPALYFDRHRGEKKLLSLDFCHDGNFLDRTKVSTLVAVADSWIKREKL
ncbi:MAG: alpha/beta hydrolase [Candidatus Liptonbacteria bacterium]|nr:alpha/beta hydrolase [Candidatus Liptonbacteria bacterium]